MELIDGITLKQYMERRGQLNWREALHFITQIMKGLGHARSRGIIHRDIKPHNIMVLRDGSVKVADFGIACLIASAENTLTQEALGSVHYISPEQAKGGHTDARTDIYSAGVVLYEMLTNRLPFEGENAVSIAIQHISAVPLSPREINPEIPEALELITMKAMASDMEKRSQDVEAMLRDLDEFRKNPSINFDYVLSDFAVEESNEPTRRINAAEVKGAHRTPEHHEVRRNEKPKRYDDYDDYESRSHKSKIPIIAGIAIGIAVIIGLFAAIFANFGDGGQEEYTVPNLLGMTVEEIMANKEITEHFKIETAGTEFSEEYEAGEVLFQSPEGNHTKKGPKGEKHVISITVSAGVETDEMPDLYNYNQTIAESMLKIMDLNLKVRIEEEFSSEVEAGHVVRTEPEKGTALKKGDTVCLIMSKGPEVKKVNVISYVGKTLEEAKAQLNGLVLAGVSEVEDESPKGTILEQTLAAGTEVEEGTEIKFIISEGVPEVSTQPGTVTKSYELPEGEGTVHVVIKVGNDVKFDSIVDKSLMAVTCDLTGTGVQQVYVIFDDVVVYSEEVDFS